MIRKRQVSTRHLGITRAFLDDGFMAVLEERIKQRYEKNKAAQILETAPGGGMYSTLAVVSRIGSVEPFARPRSLTNDIGGPPRLRFKEAQRKQKLKAA